MTHQRILPLVSRPLMFLVPLFTSASAAAQLRPDLIPGAFQVSPMIARPGQAVRLTGDVCNRGQWGTAQLWEDAVYFNNASTLQGATKIAGPYCKNFPNTIQPGFCYSNFAHGPVNVTVTIPPNTRNGFWRIGYRCNDANSGYPPTPCTPSWAFGESNHANNVAWVDIQVDGLPDFRVNRVVITPSSWSPNGAAEVSVDVQNFGGTYQNGQIAVAIYLSTSQSPSGTLLGVSAPFLLGGGQQLIVPFRNITVPNVRFGPYWVVAHVDYNNNVPEENENNNTNATPVRVAPAAEFTSFGTGCGTPTPLLAANGVPSLGNQGFQIRCTSLPGGAVIALALGLSNQSWLGVPLPIPLPSMAPSCQLLVSIDLPLEITVANIGGSANFPLPIPNQTDLLGAVFFVQALAVNYYPSPSLLAATQGGRCRIGT